MDKTLEERVKQLEGDIEQLRNRRVFQQDIIPDAIKMRAMGEGNRFMRGGAAADKPTKGENATDSVAYYYDTTAHKLWVYDNGVWKYAQLT